MKQVLIAGASGLVGRGAVRALANDCEVIATARHAPEGVGNVRFLAADLFDVDSCRDIFASSTA